MTNLRHTPVLAIDGGGTRCRIASADGDAVVSIETGSANASTDFEGSVSEILSGLQRLGAQLGTAGDALSQRPTFLGLAGITGPEIAERLKHALPFPHVRIEDDRPAALRGSLGDTDGLLAHCGTGSFFGMQLDRRQRFVGGWGPVLGDEASAQWIGRTVLSAALDTVDGFLDPSGLTERLLSEFGGSAGIVRFAGRAAPADLGTLAQYVTEADANNDPVARTVMRAGADRVADTLRQLGWHPGMAICLTGGIGPFFERYLPEDLRQSVAAPKGTPLDGAISLAFDLARKSGS